MTAQQEAFPFLWSERRSLESFIVTDSNRIAFDAVQNPAKWAAPAAYVLGGAASGKTHLAAVFTELHKAQPLTDPEDILEGEPAFVVIDDADKIFGGNREAQEKLFHLYNNITARQARLLLTGAKEPSEWVIIPDLLSRLQAAPKFFLDNPDDEMVKAAYQKLFMDRGVILDEQTLKYLVLRSERSLAKIRQLVEKLDQAALAEGKRLTRPFVGKILPTLLGE